MPSKEFEKYLQNDRSEQEGQDQSKIEQTFKENVSEQEQEVYANYAQIGQEVDQTPADNSHTPAPEDAGKKISGIEDTGKRDALSKYNIRQHDEAVEAGKTLHHHHVKADDSLEGGDR